MGELEGGGQIGLGMGKDRHRTRQFFDSDAGGISLPPGFSFSKQQLSYGFAYVFRHTTIWVSLAELCCSKSSKAKRTYRVFDGYV